MNFLSKLFRDLKVVGPGLALAATGVGVGDLVSTSVAGSRYGLSVAWAVVLGTILKYALSEGIARWQLATGMTIIEGWATYLGRGVRAYFLLYLSLWSIVAGATVISATGMAAAAMAPFLSKPVWGVIHSLLGIAWVLSSGYVRFERLMKAFVFLMSLSLCGCAIFVASPWDTTIEIIRLAAIPKASAATLFSVIGGVGGSLTLLSYGYWIREKNWEGADKLRLVRLDLLLGYAVTAIFGLTMMRLADTLFFQSGNPLSGASSMTTMARLLEFRLGNFGYWAFILGFWAAAMGSLIGTWQSIPFLFSDFMATRARLTGEDPSKQQPRWYRGFLLFLGMAPLPIVFAKEPIAIISAFNLFAAFFLPFLTATLLWLNSRKKWVQDELRNGWLSTSFLGGCLLFFGMLCFLWV